MAPVVLLAGGTGGAKLARGLLDELGPDLVVIANTGDDVEIYGAHVSPDPDSVTYWLGDAFDRERGWGRHDETFRTAEELREFDTALLANTMGYSDQTPAHEIYMGGSIRSVTPTLGPTAGIAVTCEIDCSSP